MNLFNWKMIILAAVVLIAYKKFKFHPIVYILAAGAAGVVIGG
jgi:chromate transporter